MQYAHRMSDGSRCALPVGKVVCVGRNYAAHARELGNPIADEPVLFMKPADTLVPMTEPLAIPVRHGAVHHELEMALLIGAPLCHADAQTALRAVAGVGLALDLTLRDVQDGLKAKSLPWEKAKAFAGACPLSPFVPAAGAAALDAIELRLFVNGRLAQQGTTAAMLWPAPELLAYISGWFALAPGDVVLTGTPPGVGPLLPGDRIKAELGGLLVCETMVTAAASGPA